MSCTCFIIPPDVLKRLASDRKLSDKVRAAARNTATISTEMRKLREQALALTVAADAAARPLRALAKAPAITVYDCKHHQTLPGALVAKAGTSKDATAKRTFKETTAVAQFYRTVFKRNSVDDAGNAPPQTPCGAPLRQRVPAARWSGTRHAHFRADTVRAVGSPRAAVFRAGPQSVQSGRHFPTCPGASCGVLPRERIEVADVFRVGRSQRQCFPTCGDVDWGATLRGCESVRQQSSQRRSCPRCWCTNGADRLGTLRHRRGGFRSVRRRPPGGLRRIRT